MDCHGDLFVITLPHFFLGFFLPGKSAAPFPAMDQKGRPL